MGRLDNARYERFAESIALGMDNGDAYLAAGFQTTTKGATGVGGCRLRQKPKVAARIVELMDEGAERMAVDKDNITTLLMADRSLAHKFGQGAAAGAITEKIARLHGLSFDQVKQGDSTELPSEKAPIDKDGKVIYPDFAGIAARYGEAQ